MPATTPLKNSFFLHRILTLLRAKVPVGGIEVSDTVLRFSYFDGKTWVLKGVKVPPGVLQGGKVLKPAEFAATLQALHSEALPGKDRKDFHVVACLSSMNIYTQSITMPAVREDTVDRAVELNLKIASPSDIDSMYTGWQFLSDAARSDQLQIMGAFANRTAVDQIVAALREAHFIPVAVEPRALSIARLFRNWGTGADPAKAQIILTVDSGGMDFVIIRNGDLYFDYFVLWRDLQENGKPISEETLRTALARSLNQVVNYYEQHWKDPAISNIFILAGSLYEKIKSMVAENYSLTIEPFQLKLTSPMPSDWFTVLGCGIRGTISRWDDREINVMGISAVKEFSHQQMMRFLNFWSILIPAAFSVLIAAFIAASIFISRVYAEASANAEQGINPVQQKELTGLVARATDFNKLIGILSSLRSVDGSKVSGAEMVLRYFTNQNLVITHFVFQGYKSPIIINGKAPSLDILLGIKKKMDTSSEIQNFNLPASGVQPQPDGSVAFSMSFMLASSSLSIP